MPVDWTEEPVGRHHDRSRFDCGSPDLNTCLARYARQNHELRSAMTYVAVPVEERTRILGYYSVTLSDVKYEDAPEEFTRRLGGYPVPAIRLARLAVDREYQRRGLGRALLASAAHRALQVTQDVGGILLVIDAKDGRAAEWYRQFGALPLADTPLTLAVPLDTLARTARLAEDEPGL